MRGSVRYRFVFFSAGSLALFAAGVRAATLVVDLNGAGDFTAIQPAIDAALAGDTVLVQSGEYVITEPISFKGKAITVRSESGAEEMTIRMSDTPADPNRESVVVFESGETDAAILDGFTLSTRCCQLGSVVCTGSSPTLTNCTTSSGSGGRLTFQDGSSPTLRDCTISSVYCSSSSPTLTNCTISGWKLGVDCVDGSSPTLTNCIISGKRSEGIEGHGGDVDHTGGVFCKFSSSPTLINCTITGYQSSEWAGGVTCEFGSSPTLTNCTISGNSGNPGGGLFCYADSSPILTNCTISGNTGGGLFCFAGSAPTLTNCIVWDNAGGAIYDGTPENEDGEAIVSYSCIESDDAWPGTGNIDADPQFCGWDAAEVWVDGSRPGPGTGTKADPYSSFRLVPRAFGLSLKQSSPCLGTGKDGADMGAALGTCQGDGSASRLVHLAPGTYPIEDFDLVHKVSLEGAGQEATVIQGGVKSLRTGAVLSGLTVTPAGGEWGISVNSNEAPDVRDCAIQGGSVLCGPGSSPTLTNCTISGGGYGAYCYRYSSPRLTNCTISGYETGGIYHEDPSSPTLTNCIVWSNASGAVGKAIIGLPIVTYSCIQGGWPGEGNIDQDPSFVEPGYWEDTNGDGIKDWIPGDYHLQPGSPCIDTGTCNGAPPFDIEGHVRPSGAGCDMGAYEFGSSPPGPRFHRGDPNSSGTTDISDAISIFGFLFLGDPATLSCRESADANNDGAVDISDGVYLLSWLFTGGPEPVAPGPTGTPCGFDPDPAGSAGDLGCDVYGPCR